MASLPSGGAYSRLLFLEYLTLSLNTFALIPKHHKAVWKIRLYVLTDSPVL